MPQVKTELAELVAMRSVADPRQFPPEVRQFPPEARREALSRGAKDFVNKPFNSDEVLLRIRTLLETRFLYLQIQSHNQMLDAKVRERFGVELEEEVLYLGDWSRFTA